MRRVIALVMLLAPSLALAQIPTFVSFEAVVANASGGPVAGFHDIDIEVFDSLSGGTSIGVVFGGSVGLDTDGYFSVPLSFNSVDLAGGDLFVELSVDSETITPRFAVGSVPYALMTAAVADDAVGAGQLAVGAVAETHVASGFGLVPAGIVVMWSGPVGTIPSGWALCDGNQGTPDLSNRFVRASTTPGSTGGADTLSLTTAQLPVHQHAFTSDSDGGHFHTISEEISGIRQDGTTGPSEHGGGSKAPDQYQQTDAVPAHTHTGTTEATGTGATVDNRPAYYELAFIMKL